MKSNRGRWMGVCLMGCMVLCGVLSVPPVEAQDAPTANMSADMKKVVYKNVEESLFNSSEGQYSPKEALKQMGMSFFPGASATYDAKKKTLTLVNTEKEHKIMKGILAH